MGARGNGCSVLPELRLKDRKEINTITTGMENSFGAGGNACESRRACCLRTRDYLAGRVSEDRKPLS